MIFTPATFTHAYLENGQCRLFDDVSNYEIFDVFRHPDIDKMDEVTLAAIQQKAVKITSKFNFAQYPSYEVFDKLLARQLWSDAESWKPILRWKARNQNVVYPGPFCSQLVVEIYRELSIQLLVDDSPSNEVAPSDLASSHLVQVDDIVTEAEPLTNDPRLLQYVSRMAGRLNRTERERDYPARKLQQVELLRRIVDALGTGPEQIENIDPTAIPEALAAVAEVCKCLQASDEEKIHNSIAREHHFLEHVRVFYAALAADQPFGKPTEQPDYEAETNQCLAPIIKIVVRRDPDLYQRIKSVQ